MPSPLFFVLTVSVIISIITSVFRGSAAVAQLTVNQLVAGSNPAPGAMRLYKNPADYNCWILLLSNGIQATV